jgi:hypothetical protein
MEWSRVLGMDQLGSLWSQWGGLGPVQPETGAILPCGREARAVGSRAPRRHKLAIRTSAIESLERTYPHTSE